LQELSERVGAADAEHERATAAAERAQVAEQLARSELERQKSLAAQGFTSQQALERALREQELKVKDRATAEFERDAAEHQEALARAALTRARAGRRELGERWEIRSPVAGRVLRVVQESEAVVAVGAPLVEVGDPRALEVVVDVLTADATQVRPGADAALDPGGGAPSLAGRVRVVEPAAFTKVSALGVEEQRVNVVIDIVSPPGEWRELGDGYRVDARIVVERRADAILAPVGALFRRGEASSVFVVDGGRARLRGVEVGPRSATRAVVLRGLEPGETVVVYPGDAVGDGVRVKLREGANSRAG
jgi:HlyD family secretion protein